MPSKSSKLLHAHCASWWLLSCYEAVVPKVACQRPMPVEAAPAQSLFHFAPRLVSGNPQTLATL